MARSDLLIALAKNGLRGDSSNFRKALEAIIFEERAKRHNVLAEQLEQVLKTAPLEEQRNGQLIQAKSAAPIIETFPEKRLTDLILPPNVTEICQDLISEQLRGDLLRSHNMEPRNKILLIGPPGNGKTSLAEAIAEALSLPFFVVRYEAVVGAFLGETANRLKNLFDYAKSRQCVLFFDEFETLGKERGDIHETGEIKRVVSTFLLQIDAMPSYTVIIGATNHPELLDRAVWRRFQIRVELPSPTKARLAEWFERFERRIRIDLGYSPSTLAEKFSGQSYAEVEEFGQAVFRKFILGQPTADIKAIVRQTLDNWSSITKKFS